MFGELTAVLCAVCYALSYIFIRKGQAESSPPDHGLFPILCISVLTLDGACAFLAVNGPLRLDVRMPETGLLLIFAALSGLIGTLIGRLALYRAISDLGATRGVVIKGLSPIMTLLIVVVILQQPVDDDDWVGLSCLLIAVLLLLLERKFSMSRNLPLQVFRNSIFIACFSACAQGIGHVFRQLSTEGALNPIFAAGADVTTALIGYLVILTCRGKLLSLMRWYRASLNISLIAAGVCSSLAVMLFFIAVSQIPVSTVSILVATEPIIVAFLAVIFFPKLERVTWWSAIATLVVASGVIMISL